MLLSFLLTMHTNLLGALFGIVLCGTSVYASPAPASTSTSAGCDKRHLTGYRPEHQQVVSNNVTRSYTMYVPTTYNDTVHLKKTWPLIVDYHGNGGTGYQQHNNSLYDKYTNDYLIAYPYGWKEHWQGPNYSISGIDDLQFTTDLLEHLRGEYCIDDERIYASGKSNGGGFVDTLACSPNGNEFAAFAMASAALYTDLNQSSCNYTRAILESHGTNDTTIPYAPTKDGSGGPLPQVAEWVRWWAARDEFDPNQPKVISQPGYNITIYPFEGNKEVVKHYKIFDLNHCWPSSTGDNYDYTKVNSTCDKYSLDFTPKVLEFFSSWTLNTAPGTG